MTTEMLQRANTEPWYAGMRNLFTREIYHERSRMYWIQQILVWTLFTNGFTALIFSLPNGMGDGTASSYLLGLATFFSLFGFLISIFIPVLLQGTVIDEKVSGTSAWILSKPVSKKSYLLSKLITSILSIIVVSVVINGLVGYGVFVAFGFSPNITGFIIALGLTGIVVVYFASLTVMLGTLTTNRSKVLAVAVGIGLGAQIIANYFPLILFLIPYSLPLMGLGFITGSPVQGLEVMLLSAVGQIILFTVVALSVFERTEL